MGGTVGSVLEQPPLLDGSASGPDRTVVDGAANGSSEPNLPIFCVAAKVWFLEIETN